MKSVLRCFLLCSFGPYVRSARTTEKVFQVHSRLCQTSCNLPQQSFHTASKSRLYILNLELKYWQFSRWNHFFFDSEQQLPICRSVVKGSQNCLMELVSIQQCRELLIFIIKCGCQTLHVLFMRTLWGNNVYMCYPYITYSHKPRVDYVVKQHKNSRLKPKVLKIKLAICSHQVGFLFWHDIWSGALQA